MTFSPLCPLYSCPRTSKSILYCVCNIDDNGHECTLCLEGYQDMSIHNTLCARCHNEVRSSFSLVRALTDTHMPTVHRTANITTTPQTTLTLARSRQNSTTSSTASLRLRRCSAAEPRLASSCGQAITINAFISPTHGLPTLSLMSHRFRVSRTLLSGTRFPNYQNVEALGQAWYGRTVEH